MEDYERDSTLEWDLHKRDKLKQQQSGDGFQVVTSKKQHKQQQPQVTVKLPPPQARLTDGGNTSQSLRTQQKQPQPGVKLPPPQARSTNGGNVSHSVRKQQKQPPKASMQTAAPSGRQRNNRQRRPPPRLASGSDNEGELQWRKREPARAHIRILIDLAEQDQGHFSIAKQYKTFIQHDAPKGSRGGNSTAEFGIWGEPKAVQTTMEAIRSWIEEYESTSPSKSKASLKFSKVCSLTPKLRQRAENKWESEVRKHRYRQFPPPDQGFDAIGAFHWPEKQYKPEEILGSSYEALDPIRMETRCYVVYNKEQTLFQIMGKEDAVKTGLMRIRGMYFQVLAQTVPALEIYALHDGDDYGGNVILKEYERIGTISGKGKGKGKTNREDGVACVPVAEDVVSSSVSSSYEVVRRSVLGTLKKLHYYRGSIQMRIRFGTFLATQYMQSPTGFYAIDQYKAMLQQSAFRGEVTQELGRKHLEENILNTLKEADDFLTPQDPMTHDLASIKPLLTATFTFVDPNNSELGDIQLTIIWEEHQDSDASLPAYEQVSKKWTRLDRDTGGPNSILATALSQISIGMAWQFTISAAQSIEEDRLPQGFAAYADSIKVNTKAAQRVIMETLDDMTSLNYRSSFVYLKSLEQRLTYRYNLKGSDYTLDLSRFQLRTFPSKQNLFTAAAEPTVYEARWGLSFCRIEWDTMFAKNERLPIGERANWEQEEKVWFPMDYSDEEDEADGFELMMTKLAMVQGLAEQ